MPINRVEIGAKPNDGTGDTLRSAFGKINDNLDMLAEEVAARMMQHWEFAALRHEHEETVPRYVANSAPTETPPTYGAMWINAAANKIYLATGTSSAADWREIAFVQSDGPAKRTGR